MPKSYKICFLKHLEENKFSAKPYFFGSQLIFDEVERPPSTSIYTAKDSVQVEDFDKYIIEHEVEEQTIGRVYGKSFTVYIRKGYIDGYISKKLNLVLLSGKKRDVLDFCRINKKIKEFSFGTTKIDMKKLLVLLPNVKGVWFSFDAGQITASALMGQHVEGTSDFKHFKELGNISTLSFLFEKDNNLHPVMVTEDGTVVTQANYKERADEILLVLEVKNRLLNKIIEEEKA